MFSWGIFIGTAQGGTCWCFPPTIGQFGRHDDTIATEPYIQQQAVAKRDQPQVAQDCWTFSAPHGPQGRFVAYNPYFWAILSFSHNKSAAEDLLEYLCQRAQVEERTKAVG